jgi:hypothetical protein
MVFGILWDKGMTPEPGEKFWLGKDKIRTPGKAGGCKYYCDRQSMRHVRSPLVQGSVAPLGGW